MESDRIYALTSILFEYVKSPSLRHIRDPHNIQKLATELLGAVDRSGSIWTKWEGQAGGSRQGGCALLDPR